MSKDKVPQIALILAGGLGTRLRPITNKIPKALVPIRGKPLLEYCMDELIRNGVREFVIFVTYKSDMVKRYFKDGSKKGVKISYVNDRQSGTGGALKFIPKSVREKYMGSDIIITNGDNIFKLDIPAMYRLHKKEKALITISLVKLKDATGQGVVKLKGKRIVVFAEKPKNAKNKMINSGVYIMNSNVLKLLPKKRKFSLERDFYQGIVKKRKVYGYLSLQQWCAIDTLKMYKRVLKGKVSMNITR